MATSVTKAWTSKRGGIPFQTLNSDLVNAVTFATKPNSAYQVQAYGTAYRTDDDSQGAAYWRRAAYRVDATGAVTQIGANQTPAADLEDGAGWQFILSVSGTNLLIQVAGQGTPCYWNIDWEIQIVDNVPIP